MQMSTNRQLEMERNIIKKCFRNLEISELTTIARNCAKLIVDNSVENIRSGDFKMPSRSDIEEIIKKEIGWDFDEEKIAAAIRDTYSGWNEERVDDEVDKLDDMFEEERSNTVDSIIKTTVKECQSFVAEMRKEVKT